MTSRVEPYPPQLRWDLDVDPRGDSRSTLAPSAPVNQKSFDGGGVSTPCGAESSWGMTTFVPELLKMCM